jgi:hypothetical protein
LYDELTSNKVQSVFGFHGSEFSGMCGSVLGFNAFTCRLAAAILTVNKSMSETY